LSTPDKLPDSDIPWRATPQKSWDAARYDARHSFVWRYGAELIGLLAPEPGERILDLGCGTGHLTRRIAESGAMTVGLDRSLAMLTEARKNYPELRLVVADATQMVFARPFDAVFSNAALHWILDAEAVAGRVADSLRRGGRFVLEMGGRGNIEQFRAAVHAALDAVGYPEGKRWNPKYFPSAEDYSALLEKHGFEMRSVKHFERLTPLDGGEAGLRMWLEMFEEVTLARIAAEYREEFMKRVEDMLRPRLFRDGTWWADYVRLRIAAILDPGS
jgi:trans-aconitate methyltransferase